MIYENSPDFARHLDATDSLRSFRDRFHIPQRNGRELMYLCGNSLGLQPKTARVALEQELNTWQHLGVEGWFESGVDSPGVVGVPMDAPGAVGAPAGRPPAGRPGEGADYTWLNYHERCKTDLASIVGAAPVEVCPMNALTVNLHLLLTSFYRPTKEKSKILTIKGDFPSDQYALETHVSSRGYDPADTIIEVAPRPETGLIELTDIQNAIAEHTGSLALIWMSGLNYYTGQAYDMAAIVQTARQHGVLIGFDLAHAIGNIPLNLHDWNVDFATWCSYKYLNGGPGAVSGVFVHQRHHREQLPRLAGWWGYREDQRFAMTPGFVPAPGADGWQVSTPNILALSLHRASLAITAEAGLPALRQKSELLTGFLEFLIAPFRDLQILTPADPRQRGCQLSLLVRTNGKTLFNYLAEAGIIGDWREPDCIRLAPAPLYNSFEEVWRVGEGLRCSGLL